MKGILKDVTSVGQQHINHSALVSWVTKQSVIFSVLLDDPNLPVSPFVPADSNKTEERDVFWFSFSPSAQFYCFGEAGGEGGCTCLQLPPPS